MPPSKLASRALRYVFLDRDGVLNRKPPEGRYIQRWQDFELLPGVPEAIARLNRADLKIIVVTNQRGIALGYCTDEEVKALHQKLRQTLQEQSAHIDAIFYCPHDEGTCDCRKPKPGLFHKAFHQFPDARPENSVMLGDSISDIEAARTVGMSTIFVRGDVQTRKPGAEKAEAVADAAANSLPEAVSLLLEDEFVGQIRC
jgi:D-glycero-D-manno-heptose 1,7-bisphosphate phosphatase